MSAIALELVVIIALLLVNGLFAMSELAVMRSRKALLERLAGRGHAGAQAALTLANSPTEFLSAVQVGITLIGVLAGAFGGATIAEQLALRIASVPALAPYSEALGLAIVVAAITYLSLIVGELVPKRIALTRPEAIAARIARPVGVVARIFRPLVVLLTGSTNLVLRLLGVKATRGSTVTEEEIRAMVEEGAATGIVQPEEQEIVESAFRLGDRTVASIMTPRMDMEWIDLTDPPEEIRAVLAERRQPRWVLSEGSIERIVGVMHTEDLVAKTIAGAPIRIPDDLRATAQQPLFVPDTMAVYRLLEEFRRSNEQAAIVLDEFGGVEGLVTIDDILAALVGEYAATGADHERPVVHRDDGSWLVDGSLPLEQIEEHLGVARLPVEEHGGYRTLAGFLFARLGRVPKVGDAVEWGALRFEVVDMDGRRIDKVLVARLSGARSQERPRSLPDERDRDARDRGERAP